jgi:hypothetical protein
MTTTPTMSAPISFRHRRRHPYNMMPSEEFIARVEAARRAIGFRAVTNSFSEDEIAEIVYQARQLPNPPPRPPVERRALVPEDGVRRHGVRL